jgi:hypothetical protein
VEDERYLELTTRQSAAQYLCWASKTVAAVMGALSRALSGVGLTVAVVVLALTGTVSVAGAIGLELIGVSLGIAVIYVFDAALAAVPLGIAKLLDARLVSDWLDLESGEGDSRLSRRALYGFSALRPPARARPAPVGPASRAG